MDTFFATKKGGQSSHGHTCCQLFITDKGFVYVVPMRRKSEVLQAIKQSAKGIGAPTSIIADMANEQLSQEVRNFCNNIGITLQALEEGTPWSNKAELYIGLLKKQSGRTCMNLTRQCAYGTTAWKDGQGTATSQLRTTLSCMEQHVILRSWLRRVTYPPFASLDGMNGATIMNKQLLFPTIVKYVDESWALLEVKAMRWPNGSSRLMGGLYPDDHYNRL